MKYEKYIKGNKFLTIPNTQNTINTRIIFLLTTDIKSWKLIGVNMETMEETLKILSIAPIILPKTSNAVWDILLATKQEAKQLAGSILTAKSMRLQMEYMSTQRTRIIVHGVPIDICEECMGAGGFFSSYGQVEEVTFITSKSGITTGNINITLTHQAFGNIPNILMCWKKWMLVVVEDTDPTAGGVMHWGTCPRRSPLRILNLHLAQ